MSYICCLIKNIHHKFTPLPSQAAYLPCLTLPHFTISQSSTCYHTLTWCFLPLPANSLLLPHTSHNPFMALTFTSHPLLTPSIQLTPLAFLRVCFHSHPSLTHPYILFLFRLPISVYPRLSSLHDRRRIWSTWQVRPSIPSPGVSNLVTESLLC